MSHLNLLTPSTLSKNMLRILQPYNTSERGKNVLQIYRDIGMAQAINNDGVIFTTHTFLSRVLKDKQVRELDRVYLKSPTIPAHKVLSTLV